MSGQSGEVVGYWKSIFFFFNLMTSDLFFMTCFFGFLLPDADFRKCQVKSVIYCAVYLVRLCETVVWFHWDSETLTSICLVRPVRGKQPVSHLKPWRPSQTAKPKVRAAQVHIYIYSYIYMIKYTLKVWLILLNNGPTGALTVCCSSPQTTMPFTSLPAFLSANTSCHSNTAGFLLLLSSQ